MNIGLDHDEALVLFELLADFGTGDDAGRHLTVNHVGERNALWALHAALEKALVAPFSQDYAEQLHEARLRLEERGGPW